MQNKSIESGIYVHIPFCTTKCLYCDFFSRTVKSGTVKRNYAKAVTDELRKRLPELDGTTVSSIYIGGGSPSLMEASFFGKIADTLSSAGHDIGKMEYTVEINPHDINREWIRELKDIGVNRISVGIQALDDEILKEMGRRTTVEDINKNLPVIAENFTNLSVDMIYGIGEKRNIGHELEKLFEMAEPVHISAYQYTPPERKNAPKPTGEEMSYEQEKIITGFLKDHGFIRYEVSNYAKKGFESIHNSIYWELGSWLGIGAGAKSFNSMKREHSFYDEDIDSFIKGAGLSRYKPSEKEQIEEFLLMGLRMTSGIELKRFSDRFGKNIEDVIEPSGLADLIKENFLEKNSERLYCTEKGMDFLNPVLIKLFDLMETD